MHFQYFVDYLNFSPFFRDNNTPTQTTPITHPKRPRGNRQYVPKSPKANSTSDQSKNLQRKNADSTSARADTTELSGAQPKSVQPKQHRQPVNKPKQPNNNLPQPVKAYRVTISDLDLGATKDQLQQTFETALKLNV